MTSKEKFSLNICKLNLDVGDQLTPIWGILGTELASFLDKKSRVTFGFDDVIPGRFCFCFINHQVKSRDVIVKRYHVIGKILPEILGFELASFLDKKSRCVWELS